MRIVGIIWEWILNHGLLTVGGSLIIFILTMIERILKLRKQIRKHIWLSDLARARPRPAPQADFYFRVVNDEDYPIKIEYYCTITKRSKNGTYKQQQEWPNIEIKGHDGVSLPIRFTIPLKEHDELDTIEVIYPTGRLLYSVHRERLYKHRLWRLIAQTKDKLLKR